MREFYKDFYGCAASLRLNEDGKAHLTVTTPGGKLIHKKSYNSKRGARIAMGKLSESWTLKQTWT